MTKDKSRIQSCIDHINTAVDVDPWAKELVCEMGKEILGQLNNSNDQLNNSNDCISRQAAIDICNNAIDLWQGQLGEGALVAIKNAINNLPSAQPEPSQVARDIATIIENEKDMRVIERNNIVRCKDCKYNPKDEWFGCPMSHLSEKQRPETAWCWKGERRTE